MDPICGWCYGNLENTTNLYNDFKDNVEFEILPGGLWTGENAKVQSPDMINYISSNDARIVQLTGMKFGEKYLEFIKTRPDVVLDSEVPSRVIVTASKIASEQTMIFMSEVLKARYVFGKDLNLDETYRDIVKALDIDEDLFFDYFKSQGAIDATSATFSEAAKYAQSYPTIVASKGEKFYLLEQGYTPYVELKENVTHLLQD